jgi:hypothetical protein
MEHCRDHGAVMCRFTITWEESAYLKMKKQDPDLF